MHFLKTIAVVTLCGLWTLYGSAVSAQTSPSFALTPSLNDLASNGTTSRFTARKEPVEQVLKAIGGAMGKPVHISARARAYKITGDFSLGQPLDALDRVTATLGMTWYFDGSAIYVYDGAESTNIMLPASGSTVKSLLAFLKQNAL